MLTSMTPGSGVTLMQSTRGSNGGVYPSISNGKLSFVRDRFDCAEQFEIVVELRRWRHEDAEYAVARLNAQRSAHRAFGGELLGLRLLLRACVGPGIRRLTELNRFREVAPGVHRILLMDEGGAPTA